MSSEYELWQGRYFSQFNPLKEISERTVATMLDCNLSTLKQARINGLTPPFKEFGGKIYYSQLDVHAWITRLHADYLNRKKTYG